MECGHTELASSLLKTRGPGVQVFWMTVAMSTYKDSAHNQIFPYAKQLAMGGIRNDKVSPIRVPDCGNIMHKLWKDSVSISKQGVIGIPMCGH